MESLKVQSDPAVNTNITDNPDADPLGIKLPTIKLCTEKDVKVHARELINQLDALERTYFGKDRHKQLKAKLEEVLALLDTKPIEFGKSHFLKI